MSSPSQPPAFATTWLVLAALHLPVTAEDWTSWRGPRGDGSAAPGANPPLNWSASQNILWSASIPGRGHASPIIFANTIVLTTADEDREIQSALAYRRDTGERLWERALHRGSFTSRIHKNNTHASPTPAFDGSRILVLFHQNDALQLSALSPDDGSILWQTTAGPYHCGYGFGYGASPLLHENLVIVSSEFKDGGFLAAFDRATGREVWRTPRTGTTSYSSPIVAHTGGRDQLILSGDDRISSYDPASGKPLWSTPGCAKATCGTVVWDSERVYASGGFPNKETIAVMADGSGRVAWKNREKAYEQSMLIHDGHIYSVTDNGVAFCWDAATGAERWKERLGGGSISASPVLVGDRIYATFERGLTVVYRASPGPFEKLAENQLGDETFATPVVLGNRIYLRVARYEGSRRVEELVCIGEG